VWDLEQARELLAFCQAHLDREHRLQQPLAAKAACLSFCAKAMMHEDARMEFKYGILRPIICF
jgi:hypothetical protein